MEQLIIIGTSTTAGTILKFIQHYQLYNVLGFAVNRDYLTTNEYCGMPVFAIEELDTIIDKEKDLLFVAMQWNRLNAERRAVYERLKNGGWHFANIISPHAVVNGNLEGDNCWIADGATIDFGATIGNNVFIKIGVCIGDHTSISSHCFIGAKSTIGGGCSIGEQSFVGLNSTIFDCTTIGRKCLVGACTIVKRDLPDFTRCKTPSDSMDIKQFREDEIESKLMFAKNVRVLIKSNMGGVKNESLFISSSTLSFEEVLDFFHSVQADFSDFLNSEWCAGYAEKLSRKARFVCCRNANGSLLGMIAAYFNNPPLCYISHVSVLPAYKRLGLFSAMYNYIESEAIRFGSCYVKLEVREDNLPAINAYHKSGFVMDGRSNDDKLFMVKRLIG